MTRHAKTWKSRPLARRLIRAAIGKGKHKKSLRDRWGVKPGQAYEYVTTGWRPTCAHADAPVVAPVVLDPFCGSGTVGAVARRHGRRFVGLDLSWRYLHDLASARADGRTPAKLVAELPLFQQVTP